MKDLKNNILQLLILCLLCLEASGQCVDESNYWIESWTSCTVAASPNSSRGNTIWLLLEFTEPQAISTTQIWNANRTGESGSGGENVFIDISVDGTSWVQVGTGSHTWAQASELNDYEGFAGPDLKSYGFIEKILFTFVDNHEGSACISLGELRFDIDPDACYGIIDECGICNGPGNVDFYEDADGDGLGNPESVVSSCDIPVGYVDNDNDDCDNGLSGWDNIAYVFSENGCNGCHNGPGGSGNLDLTSFTGISAGGDLCGPDILTGSILVDIISISNYDGCSSPIPFPSMNERVGGAMDVAELQLIQDWIDQGALLDCNCPVGSPDTDGDGVCDASDFCYGLDDALIGTACDDGNACTDMDIITATCECVGMPAPDSDFDGVCDVLDLAPNDPCTADGVLGMPEPSDWFANESNDCDLDGTLVSLGDLNDYDECINHLGSSLKPDCACLGGAEVTGGTYLGSEGISNGEYSGGVPDGILTFTMFSSDFLDIGFPSVEIGTEICFTLGFSDPVGGVQFEVNDLGIYKFENPDSTLDNFEVQTVCFPTFMAGAQTVRISRYLAGGVKVDGSTFDYCPCTDSDPKNSMNACACPDDSTEEIGSYSDSFGINNPERSGGASDGLLTGFIGLGDSLILTYPSLSENYEICLDVLFSVIGGKISFDYNGENQCFVNPAGFGEEGEIQKICFSTNSSESQVVVIKDTGPGSFQIDGSVSSYCNPCLADIDLDGICDDVDVCLSGDDQLDEDGDGIPDACDTCNANLIGLACDDLDNCTYDDIYDANCDCVGIPLLYQLVDNLQGPLELNAVDSINLIGDFEMLSNGYFKAGKSITILPGFETSEFMNLEIQIEDCGVDN